MIRTYVPLANHCPTQVNTLVVDVNLRCCHVGYQYNSARGLCVFINSNDVIIRQDQKNKYIFVRVSFMCVFVTNCDAASVLNSPWPFMYNILRGQIPLHMHPYSSLPL